MINNSPIKENHIFDLIEKIINHFRQNINNHYLHKVLLTMSVQGAVWSSLEKLEDKYAFFKAQGYTFKDLYETIYSAALFIHHMKTELKPQIRPLVTRLVNSEGANSRVVQTMLINNFPSNVAVYSDMINELYLNVVELDKKRNGNHAIYKKHPELQEIGGYLT